MVEVAKHYQITEFAEVISKKIREKFNDDKIGVHYNTVDKWFKTLETKRIHYILRTATDDEKVYDDTDLEIGCFIFERRRDKWRLDVIFDSIPNYFEVRPFPVDEDTNDSLVAIDEEALVHRISTRVEKQILTFVGQQITIMEQKMMSQLQTMLPAPKDEEKEAELLNEMIHKQVIQFMPEPKDEAKEAQILEEFVTSQVKQLLPEKKDDNELVRLKLILELDLEDEAIKEWGRLPERERMKKVGFFRKEEDILKRAEFIRTYKKNRLKEM